MLCHFAAVGGVAEREVAGVAYGMAECWGLSEILHCLRIGGAQNYSVSEILICYLTYKLLHFKFYRCPLIISPIRIIKTQKTYLEVYVIYCVLE